jgi:hypothetical protein
VSSDSGFEKHSYDSNHSITHSAQSESKDEEGSHFILQSNLYARKTPNIVEICP